MRTLQILSFIFYCFALLACTKNPEEISATPSDFGTIQFMNVKKSQVISYDLDGQKEVSSFNGEPINSISYTSWVKNGDIIYISGVSNCSAFDLKSGLPLWKNQPGNPVVYTGAYVGVNTVKPLVTDSIVYVVWGGGIFNKQLVALNRVDGSVNWASERFYNSDFHTDQLYPPLIDGDKIFICFVTGSYESTVVCYNRFTGEEIWKLEERTRYTSFLIRNNLWYCFSTYSITGYNLNTGEVGQDFDVSNPTRADFGLLRSAGNQLFAFVPTKPYYAIDYELYKVDIDQKHVTPTALKVKNYNYSFFGKNDIIIFDDSLRSYDPGSMKKKWAWFPNRYSLDSVTDVLNGINYLSSDYWELIGGIIVTPGYVYIAHSYVDFTLTNCYFNKVYILERSTGKLVKECYLPNNTDKVPIGSIMFIKDMEKEEAVE